MIELDYPVNALVSFHYFDRRDIGALAAGGLRLIGDSGAFSAHSVGVTITVDQLTDWALRNREHFAWVAALDVIGDPRRTWDNWRAMRSLGLDSIPTIHFGADPKELDRYASEGVDFVGLGGMVGRKSQAARLLRWTLSVFRYAAKNHPAMRFHGWGVTHPDLVNNLPFYSVDSSGPGSSYRYGRASLWDPDTKSLRTVVLDGHALHAHGHLLRDVYGLTPAEVSVSEPNNRQAQVRLAAKSVQLREQWLRARHKATAPTYGLTHSLAGTNIHYADAAPRHLNYLHGPNIHIADTDPKTLAAMGSHIHYATSYPQVLKEPGAPRTR